MLQGEIGLLTRVRTLWKIKTGHFLPKLMALRPENEPAHLRRYMMVINIHIYFTPIGVAPSFQTRLGKLLTG